MKGAAKQPKAAARAKVQKNDSSALLPLRWAPGQVGCPTAFSRSGLFSVSRGAQQVQAKDKDALTQIPAPYGTTIDVQCAAEGGLTQYDKLVFLSLLQMCWKQPPIRSAQAKWYKSPKFEICVGDGLRELAIKRGSNSINAYLQSLHRLANCIININMATVRGSIQFSGSLVSIKVIRDCNDRIRSISVALNTDLVIFFSRGGMWSTQDWSVARDLRNNQLALWIYGLYASHTPRKISVEAADEKGYKIETLWIWSGSGFAELKSFHQHLRRALQALEIVLQRHGISYQLKWQDDKLLLWFYAHEMCPEPTGMCPAPTKMCLAPTDMCPEPTKTCPSPTDMCHEPTEMCHEPTEMCLEPTDEIWEMISITG